MTRFRIEKMKEEHLDDVLRIYNHYILETTATFHAKELTRDEMRKLAFFANPRYQTFVVLDGSDVCGYVFINQHKNRQAYDTTGEVSVYLKPGWKGKGIGSLALRHVEGHARSNGFHVLVSTICSQNEASLRLFERNGYLKCAHYKEVGRKFGQWLDIVVLQKILP